MPTLNIATLCERLGLDNERGRWMIDPVGRRNIEVKHTYIAPDEFAINMNRSGGF